MDLPDQVKETESVVNNVRLLSLSLSLLSLGSFSSADCFFSPYFSFYIFIFLIVYSTQELILEHHAPAVKLQTLVCIFGLSVPYPFFPSPPLFEICGENSLSLFCIPLNIAFVISHIFIVHSIVTPAPRFADVRT